MKVVTKKSEDPADTSTETKVRFAFQRRGIALQAARLMTYKCHDKLVSWYKMELDAGRWEGFVPVTVSQV